jgi:hypothetical protein
MNECRRITSAALRDHAQLHDSASAPAIWVPIRSTYGVRPMQDHRIGELWAASAARAITAIPTRIRLSISFDILTLIKIKAGRAN